MNKNVIKNTLISVLVLLVGAGVILAYTQRIAIKEKYAELNREPIPEAVNISDFPQTPPENEIREIEEPTLPAEINLAVPMVYQAPFSNWDDIHQETCEEAAILMIQGFLQGVGSYTREQMEEKILSIVNYENETFGFFEDTTARETAEIMKDFLKIPNPEIIPLTSAEQIRVELAAGRPVILPASGKLLKNPNFRNGGPLYHMIVIKGYTKTGKFITNDPGTRLGADYLYDEATIMAAAHDWNGGDVLNGEKLIIVVK